MSSNIRQSLMLVAVSSLALVAGGCTAAFLSMPTHGIMQDQSVNLAEKNYAAADFLIQQADTFITRHHMIQATALNNLTDPDMTSDFGRLIPEQVGIRLSQLGYQIDLSSVSTGEDTVYLRPAEPGKPPHFILAGSYLEARNEIEINLRLVDVKTSRIVAAFNYVVPYSRGVATLMEPKPRVFRVSQ